MPPLKEQECVRWLIYLFVGHPSMFAYTTYHDTVVSTIINPY